ncbi:conserved hypothetical protein [Tenacibaculum sp. 190524A02b]|uniref:Uncharacterized protein n=1 Tax=Tenacibaculum vairaonense TaxID=3137860 RepID=A0ABM9PHH0_9FLAO
MKNIVYLLLLATTITFGQKKLNNYKYVIVPKQFEFVSKNDQYQTSSLTKFLFKKYGFNAYMENEDLPKDVLNNRCLALTGDVIDESGAFTTKSVVELKDCNDKLVYRSQIGKSKKKEYKTAYHEAIRNAFRSIQGLRYKYQPLKEDIKASAKILPASKKVIELKNENVKNEVISTKETLYAQPTANGFQLVDTQPKKVFELLKTSIKDVFVLKTIDGILFKSNDVWFAEYYENGTKVLKQYKIKF